MSYKIIFNSHNSFKLNIMYSIFIDYIKQIQAPIKNSNTDFFMHDLLLTTVSNFCINYFGLIIKKIEM